MSQDITYKWFWSACLSDVAIAQLCYITVIPNLSGMPLRRQWGSAGLRARIQASSRSGPHVSGVFEPTAPWHMLFGWQETEAQENRTKYTSSFQLLFMWYPLITLAKARHTLAKSSNNIKITLWICSMLERSCNLFVFIDVFHHKGYVSTALLINIWVVSRFCEWR